jgi:geranyl-CoA carboxylase alpha subunit
MDGRSVCLRNAYAAACGAEEAAGGGHVLAPMHGMLLEVSAAAGREVRRGDRLAVLEAMKMQHEIRAEVDGTIREVLRSAGEQIAAGDVILEIEVAEDRAQDRDKD